MAPAITKPAVRRGGHKKRAGRGQVTLRALRLRKVRCVTNPVRRT